MRHCLKRCDAKNAVVWGWIVVLKAPPVKAHDDSFVAPFCQSVAVDKTTDLFYDVANA
jgi:hypothetical protein